MSFNILTRDYRFATYHVFTFHQELEHETAHFAGMSFICRTVVGKSYILCSLNKSVKIIGKNSHFIIDSSQTMSLTDGVGNKRRIIDTFRQITFVT